MERGKLILVIAAVAVVAGAVVVAIAVPLSRRSSMTTEELARRYMREVPLIDGHNDWPYHLNTNENNELQKIDLNSDLRLRWNSENQISHTDIPRLKEGLVGAQFWAAYTDCNSQYHDSVRQVLDQMDVIKRVVERYPETFDFVTTAQGIEDSFANGKIASLIGVESGHNIDSSFAVLRSLYELGARYMTLTHNCSNPWGDSYEQNNKSNPIHNGLTDWGKDVVREMNRLGMLVDISHVSFKTMADALDVTEAPVIFSHTGAWGVCNHLRNAPDDILRRLRDNGGVIMVTFRTEHINCPPGNISTDNRTASLEQVADHFDYVKNVCGWQCVSFGSDFDGIWWTPTGLEDVSKFPDLVAELIRRGWTEEEVKGALGNNFLRAFRKAEEVSARLRESTQPKENSIPRDSMGEANNTCRTYFYNP